MNPEKLNTGDSSEQIRNEKEQKWQEKQLAVDQLVDKLGLGVDEGIKETVVALHVFEINTTASHEGKIDRHPIPYVDIQSAGTDELYEKLDFFGSDETETKQADLIRDEITRMNLAERKKIIPFLEEFYSGRETPYETRLGITSMAMGWSRLQSQGADFQLVELDEEVKKKRLEQFQEEMKAFTEFLRGKYFAA